MQLVRRADARAFEVVYERHSAVGLLARLPDDRHARRRRGRHAGGVPLRLALRRALRPHARLACAPGSSGSSTTARSTPCGAARSATGRRADDENVDGEARGAGAHRASRSPAATRPPRSARAMEVLPAEQVQVIELAYFGGFTHTEIADMLDTPVGTVKGRMRLGLKKLRDQLGIRRR